MTPDHQAVALYGHPFSSCTLKALTALNANDTPVAYRELGRDYPEHGAFVAAAHPAGRFPMLVDGDATVIEASAIIEHLALHYPGPAPLLPADPPPGDTRADARPGVRQPRHGQHATDGERSYRRCRRARPA